MKIAGSDRYVIAAHAREEGMHVMSHAIAFRDLRSGADWELPASGSTEEEPVAEDEDEVEPQGPWTTHFWSTDS